MNPLEDLTNVEFENYLIARLRREKELLHNNRSKEGALTNEERAAYGDKFTEKWNNQLRAEDFKQPAEVDPTNRVE